MALSTSRLKFLDVINYLAAGTSLDAFYKAFQVETEKQIFPYEWFNCLSKLKASNLPPREEFYSTLKDSIISEEEYEHALEQWALNGWSKFSQYLEFYNNIDVIGMVQAVGKMLELYKKRKLDLFKDSVSLAGITRKYVFKNLPAGVYFTRFGEEHKHIYNDLRQFGMTGGASVVFCRYHEVDKTYIKGKNLCKSIVGYDCNSMYLHCTGMKMPTSYYTLREKDSNYEIQTPYSKESLQWLEYVAKEMNVKIRHAENNPNGKKRIRRIFH